MSAARTARRRLARIAVASLAISTLALPVLAGAAVAAPVAGATAPAPAAPPEDGNDEPDTGNGGGNETSDPDPDPPDNGGDGGNNDPEPDPDPPNNGGGGNTPRPPQAPTRPTADPQADERARQEEERREREADALRERERDAAEAAREAEQDRIEAAARAAREANERREQEARARVSWEQRGRPNHMITVRTDRIEVVDGGRLTAMNPRRPGAMTLDNLDALVPNDWIVRDGDTATISAALVLTPGTAMEISGLPNLKLTGGPNVPDASRVYTGGGRLTLEGVTISSVDPGTGQPLPFEAAGRPFIEASNGGELRVVDTTITDMGMPEQPQEGTRPAVSFNPGSRGEVVRSTFQRNTVGVELSGSEGVNLDTVTVSESESDGIVLNGDRGTRMTALRAEANGGSGMFVGGENSDRPITGLSTLGNKLHGLVITQQQGAQITGISTEADEAGGLRLNQAVDVTVTDFTATDQPIGIFTHVGSTGIVLDNIKTIGGRRGVVVEKSTTNLELRNSTIEGSRVAGVNIGGKDIRVNGVQVSDSKAGVRLERGSGQIELTGMTIAGGRDGIVASPGAEDIVINDITANHVEDDAIRTASPGMRINGGTITGGTTGMDVAAAATISAVTINGSSEGMHARSTELVRAENVSIDATDLGLNVSLGTPFVLANSSVHALEAIRGVYQSEGQNNISLPPLNLLAAMGVPLILLAIVLEQVHSFRQRKHGGNKRYVPPTIAVGAG